MVPYRNLSGDSGVLAYALGRDFITVRFRNGEDYRYSCRSAGAANVSAMKRLAAAGRGLSGFISRHVRDRYERPPARGSVSRQPPGSRQRHRPRAT